MAGLYGSRIGYYTSYLLRTYHGNGKRIRTKARRKVFNLEIAGRGKESFEADSTSITRKRVIKLSIFLNLSTVGNRFLLHLSVSEVSMSRHRNVRNLTEDDYYDDYDYDDDYYDDDAYEEEDHFTQQQYAPPPKQTTVVSKIKTTTTKKLAVPGKTATTAAVGVTKPPPGWGKPSAPSSTPSAAKAGVSKPPAGWGVPSSNTTKIGGITTPPPGWGKPHPGGSTGTVKGVTAPPPGWGKPSNVSSSTAGEKSKLDKSNKRSISPKPDGRKGTYKHKLVPDVLKNTKSQLSMVVLGHVDAGKSTLMGQLLVQIGQISKRDANKQGNLSWLLDENESERERGVTM